MGMYFQDDYWQAAKLLNKSERRAFIDSVLAYYFDDEEPNLKGTTMAVFVTIRERLDIAKKRSDAGSKHANENQNDIKRKSNANQTQIKTTSNANQNGIKTESKSKSSIKEGERERERDRDKELTPSSPPCAREVFRPPTIEEIEEYCKSNNRPVDAEEFWNFYESKGWMVGKNKMKSWKGAIVTWSKKREVKPDDRFSAYR